MQIFVYATRFVAAILSPQHVVRNMPSDKIKSGICATCRGDRMLSQGQRFAPKLPVHTRSNLLLRRVTATCCLDCFEVSEQRTNLRNNYSFRRLFLPFSPMHNYLEDLNFPLVFEFHKLNIVSVFLFW